MFSPRNAILLTVLALALSVPGLGQAQTTVSNTTEWLSTIVVNPCTGAIVSLEGYYHQMFVTVVNPNGVHLVSHVNSQGVTGSDESGATYVAAGSATIVANASPGAQVFNNVYHFTLAGPGPGTYLLRMYQHLTINANGDITVDNVGTEILCPGCSTCP